ncbi:AEC family transporter [Peptostreptococcus equinus]|uniref:AEC family transporter n=1 Tax=Peptostreptococcus equinus TaxID=3003601 RepID=A0ABY7JN93_9FIRM|nr:AEC family transporter [Peptostreptococcus sp. CBA3647]WAW14316.1 AEC family transporter [Peptostreptococcus sp. CBA3647]
MQVIFTNVLILFLLLFLGYWMGLSKVVKHTSINDITNMLIDVSIPCTIIVSMIRPFSKALLNDIIKVSLIMAAYLIVISVVAYYISKLLKVDKMKQGSWIFALTFSNNAFIGYPLMFALYGNNGLFLMAIGNIVQNIFIFSIGIKMITLNYDLDEKVRIRDVVFTRQNFAVLIGMILFLGQIPVPKPVLTLITYVSNLTVPLSMMVVGLSLSRYDYKKMFTDFEVYRLTVIRMVLAPVLILILFKVLNIQANLDLPLAILFFTAALPSPAFTTIMAERYNTSIEFSSKCVFITTIISIATVPLLAGLL